jgi:hypothetical protein
MTSKRRETARFGPTPLPTKSRRLDGDDLFTYASLAAEVRHAIQTIEAFGLQMKQKYKFSDLETINEGGYIVKKPENQIQAEQSQHPGNENPTPRRRTSGKSGSSLDETGSDKSVGQP